MKKAVPMILSEDNFKQIFAFAEQYSKLAKALYNAALFRIRQVFTGWDKGDNRTPLEQFVFDEIECVKEAYGKFSCRRVLSYPSLRFCVLIGIQTFLQVCPCKQHRVLYDRQ